MQENKTYKLLIAGDLFPADSNSDLFESGDVQELFGDKITQLFRDADFSIANLEGALTNGNHVQQKAGPVIKASTESINAIKALGIKACALANNHITDAGEKGCIDTMATLSSQNIDWLGIGTEKDMKTHISLHLGDKKVCIYNVSETFFNSPTANTHGANIYDEYIVCNELKELKQTHDYIIVIYHGGSEYFRYPTPVVSKRCHRMIDAGADFITTQHTHCIGCEECYHGAYILHGQGNFCFGRHRNKKRQVFTQKGILLEVEIGSNGLSITKHLTSIYNNRKVRYDDIQDFEEFNERSRKLSEEYDFSTELTKCKNEEIAINYLAHYQQRDCNLFYKIIRKIAPQFYKKIILSYTRKEILLIQSTLGHDRRNEELKLIFQSLLNNTK